jgi:hypothetical protein
MGVLRATIRASALSALLVVLFAGGQPAAPAEASSSTDEAFLAASDVPSIADPPGDEYFAEGILRNLQARYQYLDGVTVSFGTPRGDQQAVAYYTQGRILVNPSHTADIATILSHEVWHIIDWRDNGRLDWGEDLPPDGWQDYFR